MDQYTLVDQTIKRIRGSANYASDNYASANQCTHLAKFPRVRSGEKRME